MLILLDSWSKHFDWKVGKVGWICWLSLIVFSTWEIFCVIREFKKKVKKKHMVFFKAPFIAPYCQWNKYYKIPTHICAVVLQASKSDWKKKRFLNLYHFKRATVYLNMPHFCWKLCIKLTNQILSCVIWTNLSDFTLKKYCAHCCSCNLSSLKKACIMIQPCWFSWIKKLPKGLTFYSLWAGKGMFSILNLQNSTAHMCVCVCMWACARKEKNCILIFYCTT